MLGMPNGIVKTFMNDDLVFVDTNILVYAFDQSDQKRQQKAATIFGELLDADRAVISVQVLKEFFVVATKKIDPPLSIPKAREIIEDLCVTRVVDDTLGLFRQALEICNTHGSSFWDANILAAAAASGCTRLCTEDMSHGQTIHGVKIWNPFLDAKTFSS